MLKIRIAVLIILSGVSLVSVAQESTQSKSNISVGADLASSYLLFIGLTPFRSTLYMTDGFGVINLGVSAQKTVKVTENFSLPMKLTLATNPVIEKIYLAFIISL